MNKIMLVVKLSGSLLLANYVINASLNFFKDSGGGASANAVTSISLDTLPAKLPKAIQEETNNVGVVGVTINNDDSSLISGLYSASGIEISPGIVLTAGHVLDLAGSDNPPPTSTQCESFQFTDPIFVGSMKKSYSTASFKPVAYTPDLSVIKTETPNWLTKVDFGTSNTKISTRPLKVGQALFFVNYEPEANGDYRSFEATGPAIYGGIYVGKTSYNNYRVITGLKSYGKVYDSSSRPGASGGPVFNAAGALVGLIVRATNGTSSVSAYSSYLNVNLKGVKSNKSVSSSIVQPLTPSLINEYKSKMSSSNQECHSEY